LLLRPIQRLLANAHVLGGFIGRFDGVLWTTRKPSGAQRAEGERRSVAGEPSGAQRAEGERRSVAGERSGAQRAEGERRSVAGEPSGAQRAEGERRSVGWDEPVFADNPIRFLRELYHYLQMEENPDTPPAEKIWEDDAAIL